MRLLPFSLALGCTVVSSLALANQGLPIERCGLLADKMTVWVDASGSMMQIVDGKDRSAMVHSFLNKVATTVLPHGTMKTEIYSLAPYARVMGEEVRSAEDFQKVLDEKLPKMEVMGRSSLLGERAMNLITGKQCARSVVILLSDGGIMPPPRIIQRTNLNKR